METRLETATRLLAALEDLVAQEAMLVRTMDFVDAVAIRERAAPVVERLCELAADWSGDESQSPAGIAVRQRLSELLDRAGQNYHFLETQLARLQTELDRVSEARGRLRRVAPAYSAYRRTSAGESRLNTAA